MHAVVRTSVRRDPLVRAFDDLVNEFLAPRMAAAETARIKPRVDVIDRGAAFELVADLPGVRKEDIKVQIDGERISIEANASTAREFKDGETLVFGERAARRYARSFVLPTEIEDAAAQARYEDGVLTLTLPKRSAGAPRAIAVQ